MSFTEGRLPMRIKLVQGFGAVAFGVKDNGFSFFLLIFYNQVLGMDAGLVSLALLIALLVDAVVDPILGNLSDRTYTRWGRRLPWLYAAPIPLAFAWIMLWSPPTGEAPSFAGLVGIAIAVRVLLSACEVPSASLVPEITADYDERTTLFRYRALGGWIGGLGMMILAYTVFMPGPEGLLQREGYLVFGIFGAVLMAASVIGSAAGQHSIVARLPATRPAPFTIRGAFHEITEAFSERAFLIFAAGGLAAYVHQGLNFSMTNYINLFVWQLTSAQLMFFPLVLFGSVLVMFVVIAPLHRKLGKAGSAAMGMIVGTAIGMIPFVLLLAGLWPQPGSNLSAALFYAFALVATALGILSLVSATSMIAEIVEAFEERTGRRAEGSFYSGNWLVQKCATGAGIFVSGQIIALSQLPTNAQPGEVPLAVVEHLVICYGGAMLLLAAISAWWLARFPISRAEHEARVARLAERRARDRRNAPTPASGTATAEPEGVAVPNN
ncbi:MFS transporter [Erythrobacter dokdonensis]|uniref:Galactoside symporter n=1 Tax=Erythrobacter dokdonensis DSW-74 TaxID=1300349 RepID=A0A1A7BKG5_9SPHN|nr:MFS transporter [Erythrobacter dokdonensis]OBV11665.1 Galactoside symporter [Erythrobacter dokdonensis DSW-74]